MKSEKIFKSEKQIKLLKGWKLKAKFLILKTASEKQKRKFYDFAFQLRWKGTNKSGREFQDNLIIDLQQSYLLRCDLWVHFNKLHRKQDITLINKINSLPPLLVPFICYQAPLYLRPTLCWTNNCRLGCLIPHGYSWLDKITSYSTGYGAGIKIWYQINVELIYHKR